VLELEEKTRSVAVLEDKEEMKCFFLGHFLILVKDNAIHPVIQTLGIILVSLSLIPSIYSVGKTCHF
jgi:hypothetical protein